MALTYATFVTDLADMLAMAPTDANYVEILPSIIDYSEQRIYRECDFLQTRTTDTATATANSRNFTLPQTNGLFKVVEEINVFTPVSTTVTRNVVTPASLSVVNFCWPSNTAASATTVPSLFAMITDQTIVWGPPPGAAFTVEVVGTIRPTPLSSTNTTTILTDYYPDLFMAASMIFASGWIRNFGSQADDPKMSASWEGQYQLLKASAEAEIGRQKFAGASWTSKKVEPTAVNQRG